MVSRGSADEASWDERVSKTVGEPNAGGTGRSYNISPSQIHVPSSAPNNPPPKQLSDWVGAAIPAPAKVKREQRRAKLERPPDERAERRRAARPRRPEPTPLETDIERPPFDYPEAQPASKEVDEWYFGLPREERDSIAYYRTEDGFGMMQRRLRGREGMTPGERVMHASLGPDTPERAARRRKRNISIDREIKHLDAALAKAPKHKGLVYRGLGMTPAQAAKAFRVGQVYTDKGYVSSSKLVRTGLDFIPSTERPKVSVDGEVETFPSEAELAGGERVFLKIRAKGIRGVDITSRRTKEAEVLFERSARFWVTSVRRAKSGVLEVDLDEID